MKKQPFVTLLVASTLAILGVLWVLALPSIGFAPMEMKLANTNAPSAKLELLALAVGYGASWASILAGIGIGRFKNWARRLGVISSWILGLMLLMVGGGIFFYLFASFYGFSGWYFLRPSVKAQFRSGAA